MIKFNNDGNITEVRTTIFRLPCVVDFINYEAHAVIDVIQLKGERFKVGDELKYKDQGMMVTKIIKKYPVQTGLKIQGRKEILKVRYFCNKIPVIR